MSETSRTEVDDASFIERSRHDPEAFAEVFRRYAPDITRYVTRRLGNDATEDVVAETFLAAFRQRNGYDLSRQNARPWLYGIATNLMRRHLRAEVRQLRLLERTGVDPGDGIVHRAQRRTAQRRGVPSEPGGSAGIAAQGPPRRAAAGGLGRPQLFGDL